MPVQAERKTEPSREQRDALIVLVNSGRIGEAESLARSLVAEFPAQGFAWKVLGAALQMQGLSSEALQPLQTAAQLLPRDAEAQCNLGIVLAALQRTEDAEKYFRNAIRIDPKFCNAHFNLGVQLQARGEFAKAEQSFRRTVQLNGNIAAYHEHLSQTLSAQGNWSAAVDSLRRAVGIDAKRPELFNDLGFTLLKIDRLSEAESSFRRAMSLDPNYAEPVGNLGLVLKRLGRIEEAERYLRSATVMAPANALAHYNLGICLAELRRFAEAGESYRLSIALQPTSANAHNNLGNVLMVEHRFDEARESFERALALDPDFAVAHTNMGNALRGLGKRDEAVERYRHAVRLHASLADAYLNLGITLCELNRHREAQSSLRTALELNPKSVFVLKALGNSYKDLGQLADAERCYRQALALRPDYLDAQDNLVFELNYSANRPVEECLDEAKKYGAMARAATKSRIELWQCEHEPKRLRVGLVSGDLHSHPVGYFLESWVAQLDAARVELIAYHNFYEQDDLTRRLLPNFAHWRPIHALSDDRAAQLIHDDGVHVLLDLSGHTARNRLPMFAHKPAPVQASWLGYFATTGLDTMDYIVGDPYVTPPHETDHFTERVWRLPDSYLCFTPPAMPVEPSVAPLLSNAPTFGCFNNLVKMTDEVVAVWANVLRAVPNARLLLKTWQLDDEAECERTRQRFAERGIDRSRLLLEGKSPRVDLLASYRRVDVALDPFPYPGGTTSVESYWMGVPVITRKGDRFVSHVGETIAHNLGLSDWIANDNDDYVAKAVAATTEVNRLAKLRGELRARLLASPLCDAPRFANNFADAVWGMWKERSTVR